MRLKSLYASNVPPVRAFEVQDLDDVVVLAGRNGVGKTRLLQAVISGFQHPSATPVRLVVEATNSQECEAWGKTVLDTADVKDAQKLTQTLQQTRRRRNWTSSVVHFESDRTIQQVKPYKFTWDVTDPWEEPVAWGQTMSGLRNRFQDTLHSIFRKKHQLRNQIAARAEQLRHEGKTEMKLTFTDPLEPFREAFVRLLGPKKLLEADLQSQTLTFENEGSELDVQSGLSSGEREVVNIVFDLLLRKPSDCIVFLDEPELHLHPELSHKLLSTLRSIGERNQFVLCTHAPSIITAALDQSVVFVGPPTEDGRNQALKVSEEDATNEALRALGHSVGVIALGRRIVLIEGGSTSLDKQTYETIIRERFSELVLVPSEGQDTIKSFAAVNERVLKRSVWGVDFFMLCDRDAIPPGRDAEALSRESGGRLALLPRYHLENYFLDSECLALVFEAIEGSGSWLRDPVKIDEHLRENARACLPYTVALYVAAEVRDRAGNVDIMPKGVHGASKQSLESLLCDAARKEEARIGEAVTPASVQDLANANWARLEASLETGEWRSLFPGRSVLRRFAKGTALSYGRIKTGYLNAARRRDDEPFREVLDIFERFVKGGLIQV
jgi:ABC-type cobalamin/Fe3+-siderophores transport system ATPase subunit